jgi:hypothetical protein
MKTLLTSIMICSSVACIAQSKGQVTEIKDPLIDSLIARRLALSKAIASVPTGTPRATGPIISIMGYRVQVFYGSDRREMYSEQARFKSEYPKMNTYITYKEPNYYLRVGDFRTRLEAQRFMNELRPQFPTLFIFREKINAQNLEYSNEH